MSQNQETMMSKGASDALAAEMPSVPGAETAKSIIENAVHPHQSAGTTAPAGQTMSASTGTQPRLAVADGGAQRSSGTTATSEPFVDQVIELPIMGEELTFSKRAMVTEEVRLQKRPFTEQQNVTGDVRRERVTVEGADAVEGADDQIDYTGSGGPSARGARQDMAREGAANAKHGIDGMIDSAVDKIFGHNH